MSVTHRLGEDLSSRPGFSATGVQEHGSAAGRDLMDAGVSWIEEEIPESPTDSVLSPRVRPPQPTMLTEYLQGAKVMSRLPAPRAKGRSRSRGSKKRNPLVTASNGGATEQQVLVRRVAENADARNQAESCALKESEPPSQEDKIKGKEKVPGGNVVAFNKELVAARLRQLSIFTGGCAMDAAEVEANRQEQEDEMMVLQAIFGEDLTVVNTEGCPPVVTISIHVETPDKVIVSAELPSLSVPPAGSSTSGQSSDTPENSSSRDGSTSASTSDRSENEGNVHDFAVQFLPPITFMCTFPPTYPSRSPPNFVLMSWWLQQSSLASLCRVLDSIWKDQQGQVVCYAWASWLQENYLNHLGFVDKVVLGLSESSGAQRPFNVRAISGCYSVDVVVPRLLSYNEEKLYQRFCASLHLCNICLSEFPGKEFVRLPCCHTSCRPCMRQYCGGLVKEGSVNKMICPDTSCKQQIPPFLLKELLTALDFQRWEDLTLQRALDAMVDIEYCPRCQMACIEDKDHHVQCGKCFYSFCSICRAQWHVIDKCASSEEMLAVIQARQRRSLQMGAAQRKKEQDQLNDILSMKVVNADSIRCPTCNIAIQKDGGCNKMYCTYCCSYFCFICRAKIDDYKHFGENKCALFERADIERWEAEQQNV